MHIIAIAAAKRTLHLFGSARIDDLNAAPVAAIQPRCVAQHHKRLQSVIGEDDFAREFPPIELRIGLTRDEKETVPLINRREVDR